MRVLILTILFVCISVSYGMWQRAGPARGSSLATGGLNRLQAMLAAKRSSLFGGRVRTAGSIFGHLSSKVKQAVCHFDRNNIPQFDWPTKSKLCFNDTSVYPTDRLFAAVVADPDAMEYLTLVQECYLHNRVNSSGSYGNYRYRDLCDSDTQLLERIWWTNTNNGRQEVCYVIMPEAQGVAVANCGRKNLQPGTVIQQNCRMDKTKVQHHYCVPDGFVDRDIYVFCPGEFKQCRRTKVTIPTGCSCKKYDCLKYEILK